MSTHPALHLSTAIGRSPADVYRFASNPENLPRWAAGLARASVVRDGEQWLCESPMGRVRVRFAPENALGVMDHDVTLPSGDVVHNPFRVLRNGDGSEVAFTLYRLPGTSEDEFRRDATLVRADLERLKTLLEAKT